MPTARGMHAISVISGKIYVAGGAMIGLKNEIFDALESYDPMPTGRPGCKSVVLDDKLYVLGGLNPELGNKFEMFDPVSNSWSILPDISNPVSSMTAYTLQGKIFITGGSWDHDHPTNLIQVYEPTLKSWSIMRVKLPYKNKDNSSCVFGDLIYMFGRSEE